MAGELKISTEIAKGCNNNQHLEIVTYQSPSCELHYHPLSYNNSNNKTS
jgi:pantothenate kinase-related protein Tda10